MATSRHNSVIADVSTGKSNGFEIITTASAFDFDDRIDYVIDLSYSRRKKKYEKLGGKLMIQRLKEYVFGDPHLWLTEERCRRSLCAIFPKNHTKRRSMVL